MATLPVTAVVGPDLDPAEFRMVTDALDRPHLPSPNSTELLWSPLTDFAARAVRSDAHVAELFHVNSKLARRDAGSVCSPEMVRAVRRWFLGHVTAGVDLPGHVPPEVAAPHAVFEPQLRRALHPFAGEGQGAEMLFAVDLVVVADRGVFRQVPGRPVLWRERPATTATTAVRRNPPRLGNGGTEESDGRDFIAVVAVPWRYMALLGPHGYRRTLLDAGSVIEILGRAAREHGQGCEVLCDLYQQDLDEMLGFDGVERSVVALVEVSDS